jgi:hypothetical protein
LQVNVSRRVTRRFSRCVTPSIVLIGLTTLCAHTVSAQAPANRLWGSVGGGYGHSGPANSTGLDQFSGPTGDLAIGASMTARGVIGLEVAAWKKSTPIGSSRSTFVTLTLLGYPFGSVLDNLYFQGGLGVGNGSFPTQKTTTTPTRLNVTRPALQVSLGYDIPVACPLWISPVFQSYGTIGGHRLSGPLPSGQHESANAILFHAGVSLRFIHPGPRGNCRNRGPALTE